MVNHTTVRFGLKHAFLALLAVAVLSSGLPGAHPAAGQAAQQPSPSQSARPAQSAPGQRPACVAVTWTVRYGADSYNHWVTISNGCDALVRCTVRTNVNQAEATVELAPAQSREVNTFLGSPAREFTPTVNCTRGDGEPARATRR